MKGLIIFGALGIVFIVLGIVFGRRKKNLFLAGFGSAAESVKDIYDLDMIARLIRTAVIVTGFLLLILGACLYLFPGYELIVGITVFSVMLVGLFILVTLMNSRLCKNGNTGPGKNNR